MIYELALLTLLLHDNVDKPSIKFSTKQGEVASISTQKLAAKNNNNGQEIHLTLTLNILWGLLKLSLLDYHTLTKSLVRAV